MNNVPLYVGVLHCYEIYSSYPLIFGYDRDNIEKNMIRVVEEKWRANGCSAEYEIFTCTADKELLGLIQACAMMGARIEFGFDVQYERDFNPNDAAAFGEPINKVINITGIKAIPSVPYVERPPFMDSATYQS